MILVEVPMCRSFMNSEDKQRLLEVMIEQALCWSEDAVCSLTCFVDFTLHLVALSRLTREVAIFKVVR